MDVIQSSELLKYQGFIGGEWVSSDNTFAVINPADGSKLADVSDLNAYDTQRAIDAADQSLRSKWSSDIDFRVRKLSELKSAIQTHLIDLSIIETLEQGKPIEQAKQEWRSSVAFLDNVIQQAQKIEARTITSEGQGVVHQVIKRPIGIVAAITPWNFPVASVLNKCVTSMAAGCSVVLKPSELTPLSALSFAHLVKSVDIPAGVLNVIPTVQPDEVGQVLMRDSRVRMLTFTGSTAIGKNLAAAAATTVKRVELELGGNAPFIVFSDGKHSEETEQLLESAASALMGARFYNNGQICVGANRVYIEQEALPSFLDKLLPKVENLLVGPGIEPATECGPLISEQAIQKIEHLIDDASSQGATILLGGKRDERAGHYFMPTVITDITSDMAITNTEIFGPVVAIQTFTDQDDVLAAANDTPAGLAAYFFSADQATQARFSRELQAGMVGCNTTNIFDTQLAFGGLKESGYGREGGDNALDPFLVEQNISFGNML